MRIYYERAHDVRWTGYNRTVSERGQLTKGLFSPAPRFEVKRPLRTFLSAEIQSGGSIREPTDANGLCLVKDWARARALSTSESDYSHVSPLSPYVFSVIILSRYYYYFFSTPGGLCMLHAFCYAKETNNNTLTLTLTNCTHCSNTVCLLEVYLIWDFRPFVIIYYI